MRNWLIWGAELWWSNIAQFDRADGEAGLQPATGPHWWNWLCPVSPRTGRGREQHQPLFSSQEGLVSTDERVVLFIRRQDGATAPCREQAAAPAWRRRRRRLPRLVFVVFQRQEQAEGTRGPVVGAGEGVRTRSVWPDIGPLLWRPVQALAADQELLARPGPWFSRLWRWWVGSFFHAKRYKR